MLWTPVCDFNWSVDNLGSTFTDAGLGTQLTAGGTAHTKNATKTSILSALAYDCYWLTIGFTAGNLAANSRRFLVDIYTDPAGGTSWGSTPLIANLAVNAVGYAQGGVWYRFPIYIKAGTSIGATCQAEAASATVRIILIAQGQPSHPELVKVGRFVRTFGATTASTTGIGITPGASGAMGGFANLVASISEDLWWWQLGVLINDATQTAVRYWCDLAGWESSSGNTKMLVQGSIHTNTGTAELSGRTSCSGIGLPYGILKAANSLVPSARAVCDGTADSNFSTVAYGVGG